MARDEDEDRHDQLTAAPRATTEDTAPRVETDTSEPGLRRVTVRDDAEVRPGSSS